MKKRARLAKRGFAKRVRRVHRSRLYPARVWRLKPDPALPYVVELRVSRNNRCMQQEQIRFGDNKPDPRAAGSCYFWFSTTTRDERPKLRAGLIVARILLNVHQLRDQPSELPAHECTHAGIAWARYRRADVFETGGGEEVLAYAVGRLVVQANRVLYAMNAFP